MQEDKIDCTSAFLICFMKLFWYIHSEVFTSEKQLSSQIVVLYLYNATLFIKIIVDNKINSSILLYMEALLQGPL